MWDNANPVLLGTGGGLPFWDHMGWGWMSGLHGLFWLLVVAVAAAILVASFRLGTRDIRSNGSVAGSSARRRRDSARNVLDER